ncbi:bifunctional 3-(3-hydroxy-phenyl)propionate/3-hydroxycinnamic acid hydroxylase [Nocardia lijiangensis]|uniref:bifunctional 3-(3-hydroxy-phenyl)propionate/3-hydroxycinnamic acid hydroxylase MhpA n=1 Tax=Nocardia lijiangensis TaxID=299618 RepID=UPI00082A06D9|nr:bifunctional 3-(3-hydroxy-phenyl)propionate/3-hydroxycinnamic acid hydroxylase [Nocardia lijiangensis]
MASDPVTPWDFDVIQIGCGPVGQTMAALLGQHGHRVGVFERWPTPYPLPRAGHIDHEIMRILQSVGAAHEFEPHAIPVPDYDWFNGDGDLLLHLDWNQPTPSGWKSDYLMFQPDLQDALLSAIRRLPSVELNFGWNATRITQHDDHVEVTLAHGTVIDGAWTPDGTVRTVTASWLLGADGANSTVRAAAELGCEDLGFEEEWLVVDIEPHDPDIRIDMPEAGQYCDPRRPVSLFRWLGRAHTRWEFMLLPGESAREMTTEARCWELLSRWKITPDEATIIRRTVYTFRSLLAESWRRGRTLLIGDAAHLMPPFLGQGMCSGIRDAANLAWKLDLVLSGRARDSLLDTYGDERRPHARSLITMSMELGRIVCLSDPEQAAARDRAFRSGDVAPPPPFPILTAGLLHRNSHGVPAGPAGTLGVQPRVHWQDRTGLCDDLIGGGWTLMTSVAPDQLPLDDDQHALLRHMDTRIVHLTRAKVPGAVIDIDADLTRWLARHRADVVLVRPDFYVFGAARVDHAGELVDSLRRQMHPHMPAVPA